MNTTAKWIAGMISVFCGLCPCLSSAGAPATSGAALVAANVLGQAGASPEAAARTKVLSLISEARAAIEAGDYTQADALVTQAEQMNVRFTLFHRGDTPAKVRRDLEKATGKSNVALPSARFQSPGAKPVSDPFLDGGAQSTPTSATPMQLNAGRQPGNAAPTVGGFGSLAMKTPDAPAGAATQAERAASDQALLAARLSLSVGDTRTARSHLAKAQQKQIQYGPYEDSPAKVDEAIKKFEDLSGRRQQGQNTEAWRRQYAHLLIDQADALVRWGKLDEAERLAGDAGRLGIVFGQFERSPQTVLAKITETRQGTPAAPADNQPTGAGPGLSQPGIAGPQNSGSRATPTATANNASPRKAEAMALVAKARQALANGDIAQAEQFAQQAQDLKVPDSEFAPGEDRPWLVALAVQNGRNPNAATSSPRPGNSGVVQAEGNEDDRYAQPAVYDPSTDGTENTPAGVAVPTMPATPNVRYAQAESPAAEAEIDAAPTGDASQGMNLFRQGETALRNQDKEAALEAFRQAYQFQDQLDPPTQQRLQDHLQMLSAPQRLTTEGAGTTLIDSAAGRQQLLARQVSAEVARFQSESRRIREQDPQEALKLLEEARAKVEASGLEATSRAQLMRRVDLSVSEVEKYISQNRAQIELDARNKEVRDDVKRSRLAKLEMQQKIADLVEQFNKLIDEHRYEEAEVVARRARELAPEEPVVQQLWVWARHNRRAINQARFLDEKENAVFTTFQSVEESAMPFDDSQPFRYGDAKDWEALTSSRRDRFGREGRTRMTERELEIQRKLKTPVSVQFHERPLAEVVDQLARLTGVNVHLDPRGLAEEGVTSATPVTLSLTNDISLRSALNLILEPLHLSYVIKDEVLKITSEQLRDGEVYTVTYNVADLVIPIPNFTPGNQLGLTGMLNEAYAGVGYGSTPGALAAVAGPNGSGGTGMINPQVMAQMNNAMGGGGSGFSGPGQPTMGGPGGLGGGAQADFDALIELITATIQPNTWDEVGGPGSVKEFATNLSLVVSQTQDVHEEIVDLLEQLRRLQDLQVTIEVRFITLTDGFFEQIGVDFDFNIDDNDPRGTAANLPADHVSPSTTVGLQVGPPVGGFALPAINANLDLPFRQDSINQAGAPSVPGVNVADFAQFGFAILSDIEAYFLVRAAQADSRSNILEAPKVTLFNGQQAFVSDTAQRPFVISVIPVVGDFAAAQQPVIVVLSEGTFLSLQAVVSPDRRYVRLTIVPFFSQIGDVEEFTFEGSSTTTGSMSETGLDDNDNPTSSSSSNSRTTSGTTVQLPTFVFTTVTTTVSVPDGGTVLLGGIKRLTESRNEAGIPLLSKVPYVNRLFKNVGITRFTQSLLMMVTPRIIIQEEEEEKLGIESF